MAVDSDFKNEKANSKADDSLFYNLEEVASCYVKSNIISKGP